MKKLRGVLILGRENAYFSLKLSKNAKKLRGVLSKIQLNIEGG